jgi:hypothetical protein
MSNKDPKVQLLRERVQELRFRKLARCLLQAAEFILSQIDHNIEQDRAKKLLNLKQALVAIITPEREGECDR